MMKPAKSKQEIVSEFRTAEILDAARKVFTEKGFRDSTVDEIAETAGVSKGTVYLYFPSKQEIYVATIERGVIEYRKKLEEALTPDLSPRQVIQVMALSMIRHMEENRAFLLSCIAELGRFPSEKSLPEPIQKSNKRQREIIAQALEQGMATDTIRSISPERATEMIFYFMKSWAIQRITMDTLNPAEEDAALLSDIVWKGISQ